MKKGILDVGDDELRCRDTGHQWDEIIKRNQRPPMWGEYRNLLCVSCSSERREIVNTDGTIDPTTRGYELTEAYQLACEFDRYECRIERRRRMRKSYMSHKSKRPAKKKVA